MRTVVIMSVCAKSEMTDHKTVLETVLNTQKIYSVGKPPTNFVTLQDAHSSDVVDIVLSILYTVHVFTSS